MARPTRLTASITKRICDAVVAGNYLHVSAMMAGVPRRTFYDWLKKGNQALEKKAKLTENEKLYAEFVEQLEEARSLAEVRHVAIIAQAAERYWQAAAWWLERSKPDRWGQRPRKDTVETGDTTEAQLSDHEEWLKARLDDNG